MSHSSSSVSQLPFNNGLDTENFYLGTSQEEALSRLHFLVDNGRRLGLLVGSSGSGKSTLLNVFSQQSQLAGRDVILTSVLGVDHTEFLWKVAAGLGANPRCDATLRMLWRGIDDRILANRYQRRGTVLMIDDADEADVEVQTAVSRLVQSSQQSESQLAIVLAAEASRAHVLLRRLQELAELRIELEPWDVEETEGFIRETLARAGCEAPSFEDSAINRLHELSGGVPRRVQQLAELTWIAGVGQDLERIDESTVDAVDNELTASRTTIEIGV